MGTHTACTHPSIERKKSAAVLPSFLQQATVQAHKFRRDLRMRQYKLRTAYLVGTASLALIQMEERRLLTFGAVLPGVDEGLDNQVMRIEAHNVERPAVQLKLQQDQPIKNKTVHDNLHTNSIDICK